MAITNKEIEELQQRKRELDAKLKMHEAGMRSRGIGAYQKKQKAVEKVQIEHDKIETKVLKEVLKEVKVPENDVEYELTPKAMEMASKLSKSKVVNNIVSNPIASSLTNIKGEKNQSQPKQKNYKTNQPKQSTSKRNKRKDPNYSSIAPGISRPLKLNDTTGDILGKIYNFMFQKYHRDVIELTNDAKYRRLLHNIKERRIEELIRLFGGKYKKVDAESEKKLEDSKKGPLGKIFDNVKNTVKSIFGGIRKTLGGAALLGEEAASTPAVSTVVKIAAGVAAAGTLTGAAALSAKMEVGYGTKNNLGPGAIVKDSGGGYSYGYFGINSKGGEKSPISSFIRENPQFGLKSKPGTTEFNEEWKKLASTRGDELTTAQQDWYNKHVLTSVVSDYSKILPVSIISDDRVQAFLADRRNQYGDIYDKAGIIANKDASTPEDFIKKLAAYDKAHIEQNFPTALATEQAKGPGKREQFKKGLENRISNRESGSLSIGSPAPVRIPSTKPSIPTKINNKSTSGTSSVSVLNNNTNIINGSTNMAVMSSDNNSYPVLIDKQYYNYG